jgi:hypothetical protein
VFVGTVQARATTQAAVGALAEVTEPVLPLNTKVPMFGNVFEPEVNVVAAVVMCQPAPVPVASRTVSC